MWTPRRIFLALFGFLLFGGGYFTYSAMLGSFDGLPPLPASYQPDPTKSRPIDNFQPTNSLERKFEIAFGPNCPELSPNYPIKIDLEQRGTLIAAQELRVQTESDPRPGWIKVWPLSLGMLGKKYGSDGLPEVNTPTSSSPSVK